MILENFVETKQFWRLSDDGGRRVRSDIITSQDLERFVIKM